MKKIIEAVNRFKVRCEGCEHPFQTALIENHKILLHARVDLEHAESAVLPTPRCRLSYDYVLFRPCGHCCPEVFADCPEAHHAEVGQPTDQRC